MTTIQRSKRMPAGPLRAASQHAFTLFEILLAVGLMAAFGLVASYAFTGTMRLSHQTSEAQDTLSRNQRLLDVFRRDVWGAATITVTDEQHVTLTDAQGTAVTWRWADDALARQAGDAAPHRWAGAARSVTFAAEGPVLRVALTDDAGRATVFRFVSQLRLAREEAR